MFDNTKLRFENLKVLRIDMNSNKVIEISDKTGLFS